MVSKVSSGSVTPDFLMLSGCRNRCSETRHVRPPSKNKRSASLLWLADTSLHEEVPLCLFKIAHYQFIER